MSANEKEWIDGRKKKMNPHICASDVAFSNFFFFFFS